MTKTALITGGAGGIGSAICKSLAADGYDIILHYNNSEAEAEKIRLDIEKATGQKVYLVQCDLSYEGGGKALFEKVQSLNTDVDVLVNNAAVSLVGLFQCCEREKVREVLNVNLVNALELTEKILPQMISRKSGNIINISSMWGIKGASCEVHYSTTKAALIGFTKALSKEVGPSAVRVNCVAPGFIETKMNACFDKETVQAIVDETPLCRVGKPEDVANAVSFLVSDKASFITGQTLCVDGGLVSM